MEKDSLRKCLRFCFHILIFCFLFVMLGIFAGELDNVRTFESIGGTPNYNQIQLAAYVDSTSQVYDEIKLAPIKEIYLVNSNDTCGSNSILELYYWNTNILCNCPYDFKITVGKCARSASNCYTTSSRALSLNNWRGKKFCVSRYVSGMWYKTSDSCSTDSYLTCNFSGYDICIKKSGNSNDDVCPISQISIVSDQSTLPSIEALLKQTEINNTIANNTTNNTTNDNLTNNTVNNTTNITNNATVRIIQDTNNLTNSTTSNTSNSSNSSNISNMTNSSNQSNSSSNASNSSSSSSDLSTLTFKGNFSDTLPSQLYYSRNTQYPPIINLKVAVNGKPCVFSLEENLRASTFHFLQADPNGCQQYGSDVSSYSLLDRQYEWNFYVENNLLEITSDLLNMQSYIKDISQLYSETWAENSCDKNLDMKIVNNIIDTEELIDSRKGSDVIGLLLIVTAIILFCINLFYCIKRKELIDSINLNIWLIIFIIIEEIICPISLYYANKIESDNQFLYVISDTQCFKTDGYNRLFDDLRMDILINTKKFRNFSLTILYYSMLMFIIFILYVFDKFKWNYAFAEDENGPLEDLKFRNICDEDDCTCEDCLI